MKVNNNNVDNEITIIKHYNIKYYYINIIIIL